MGSCHCFVLSFLFIECFFFCLFFNKQPFCARDITDIAKNFWKEYLKFPGFANEKIDKKKKKKAKKHILKLSSSKIFAI